MNHVIRFVSIIIVSQMCTFILGQNNLDLPISPDNTWGQTLMTQMSEDSILVLGVNKTSWELITIIRQADQIQKRLIGIEEATPTLVTTTSQGILIGGSLKEKPAIWNYKTGQESGIRIIFQHDNPGLISNILDTDKGLLVLVENSTHFSLNVIEEGSNQFQLIDQFERRSKDEKVHLKLNQFGEIYLVRSTLTDADLNPVSIRKYNDDYLQLWEKTYPMIQGMITGLLIHSTGDLLAIGINQIALEAHTIFARWAPSGDLILTSEEINLNKSLSAEIGWINEHTFWHIGNVIPFAARFPDIEIKEYSWSTLKTTKQSLIAGKNIEHYLAHCIDEIGNVSILYRKKRKETLHLRYIPFNQDPCTESLGDQSFQITYNSRTAPITRTGLHEFVGHIKTRNRLFPGDVKIGLIESNTKAPQATNLQLIDSLPNQYCYKFTKRFFLEQGENNIRFTVAADDQTFSDTISVYHVITRPRLFIFSVGVVYEDLNFTHKDASDFIALFNDQEGRLFEQVSYRLLNTKEDTRAASIVSGLDEFSQLGMQDEDLVFIFFSSHGELVNEDFSILGSSYNFDDPSTMVHFKTEIINRISKIPGKKVLFLDACKSGNLKGAREVISPDLVSSIFRVVASDPGILAISSSTDQESSYEVNDLQNGIFTAAIKESFIQNPAASDTNGDQVITIGELYDYLRARVPQLINEYFKDPNRKQNPTMPLEDIDRALPIYYISKSQL